MSTLSSTLSSSKGFHPTLRTTVYIEEHNFSANSERCSLYLAYALPPLVFIDPYELVMHSEFYIVRHRILGDLRVASLELPVVALPLDATSVIVLDLNLTRASWPDGKAAQLELVVDVPLHLRYGNPASRSHPQQMTAAKNSHHASLPWPKGFWRCPRTAAQRVPTQAERESIDLGFPIDLSSLLLSTNSPTSASPSPPSMWLHTNADSNQPDFVLVQIPSSTSRGSDLGLSPNTPHPHTLSIHVPIGNLADLRYVEGGLAACILFAFVWLLRATAATARRLERREDVKMD